MGIHIKNLDIFDTDPKSVVIGHQANCCAVMGAGIAFAIKDRYPEAYSADMAYHWPVKIGQANPEKLGEFSFAFDPSDSRWIVNLYGQLQYGREKQHTDYEALATAIRLAKVWMLESFRDESFPKILAIPYGIGCGLGGGDWNTIMKILEETFQESMMDLWICRK